MAFESAAIQKYLDHPHLLISAVVRVQERYARDGRKPGAERWTLPGKHNESMIHDVEEAWNNLYCNETGEADPPDFFPYTVGHVSMMWIRYRKDTSGAKDDIRADLNMPTIPRPVEAMA